MTQQHTLRVRRIQIMKIEKFNYILVNQKNIDKSENGESFRDTYTNYP